MIIPMKLSLKKLPQLGRYQEAAVGLRANPCAVISFRVKVGNGRKLFPLNLWTGYIAVGISKLHV